MPILSPGTRARHWVIGSLIVCPDRSLAELSTLLSTREFPLLRLRWYSSPSIYRVRLWNSSLTCASDNDQAGSVSYTVYLLFIAIQAAGPLVGMLLTPPSKVERKDGKKVSYCLKENGHITHASSEESLMTCPGFPRDTGKSIVGVEGYCQALLYKKLAASHPPGWPSSLFRGGVFYLSVP